MSSATVAKHYARLISLWPKDLLRPNHSFTKTIQHRAAKFAPLPAAKPPPPTSSDAPKSTLEATSAKPQVSEIAIPKPSSTSSIPSSQAELRNINALYSLLENRYSKQYPVSQAVLKPRSNPEYYDRLMKEIEDAPKKSWFRAKLDEWKMKIRFKPPPGMSVN